MPDQTATPTYAELMDRANRAEERIVRLTSEAERAEERLTDERDNARARVTELTTWQDRFVRQARRAADSTDRWNRLWAAAGSGSVELADMIDAVLDQRDQARAVVAKVREALLNHPRCDYHPDDDTIGCGWQRAVTSVQWALDTKDEL